MCCWFGKGHARRGRVAAVLETELGRFPALQFVTLAKLFQSIKPKLPPLISPVNKASRAETRASQKGAQAALDV